MTDLAQGQAARPGCPAPSPSRIGPRQPSAAAESGRAAAKAALDAALSGVELSAADRRFISRLCQWDKRNATAVVSLVARARQAGQGGAELGGRQLEIVLAALMDAFAYRTSGAAADGCWECANRSSGLCVEHAKDADRARAFADMASELCRMVTPASIARLDTATGLRQRRAAVAS